MGRLPMTKNSGVRSVHRGSWVETITMVCCCLMALATLPLALGWQRHAALLTARAWTIAGPPCPVVSQQSVLLLHAPTTDVFSYGGARFARAYGYAKCSKITADPIWGLGLVTVCQFNNPTLLEITTARGHWLFMTGIHAATVVVDQGRPACEFGAKLGDDWLQK